MSFELLTQLEAKVATTLDSLEILRMEMDELKEENVALKNEKLAWETRLGQLLGKFSELEPSTATTATETKDQDQDDEQNEEGNEQYQEDDLQENDLKESDLQKDDLLDLDSIN